MLILLRFPLCISSGENRFQSGPNYFHTIFFSLFYIDSLSQLMSLASLNQYIKSYLKI